ncbi:hypothetical protein PC9H_001527 [Pleurotus ostreatus]|uniref:Heterokaryon incompatibility domain-containing protein n=1 Tax=Pleurotus ostreatus TaxID=5322 RepID=A0A8H7A3A3_PLEOS|nr:uncharacterized protein PC9H_001527 [Pleurotus ostreatus]KAF7441178.1 hypothetical protein PC9H_001527 [Pleurotus ostreatus]KAJ8699320.1 hypothetical protein PTI98_002446 [Pleurotus ostreatus]
MRRLLEFPSRRLKQKTESPLCSTCSKLDLHHILLHGVLYEHPILLGPLVEVLAKAGRCALCGLIKTAFQRFWLLDKLPADVDLGGVDLGLYAERKGNLIAPRPPERELCHRLIILPSDRPQVVYDILSAARSNLVLHIQLMQEDARVFKRRPDVHGRRVGDVVAIDLVKKWLNLCVAHHHDVCEEVWWRDRDEELPSSVRMIDVKKMAIVPYSPRSRYVALSYVWGGVGAEYQSMRDNISQRMTPGGLDESILPATIVDAIELCRRLGERYLWVDALCIIQDSAADKAVQIGVMELIYGGSFVTVFAIGGHNAHAGLPGLRKGTRTRHQRIERIQNLRLSVPLTTLASVLAQSVWGTRGWTYQEVMLSRRRLFFTDEQVYFECLREVFSEDVVAENTHVPGSNHPLRYTGIGGFTFNTRPRGGTAHEFTAGYVVVVREYTQRNLTNELDAIDAVSALTRAIAKAFNLGGGASKAFRYGMLITDLNQTLFWHPGDGPSFTRRRSVPGLRGTWPSWAWVGWRGAVQYRHNWSNAESYPRIAGSLVDVWYIYEDGNLVELDVNPVHRMIFPDVEKQVTRYSPPSGRERIVVLLETVKTQLARLPEGTLIFYATSATFKVLKLAGGPPTNDGDGRYELYAILPSHGPKSENAAGRVYLPSDLSSSELEFIVLAYADGQNDLHDEEAHGKRYSTSFLYVMAVRSLEAEGDGTSVLGCELVERVGVGIVFEPVWLDARPQEKLVCLA